MSFPYSAAAAFHQFCFGGRDFYCCYGSGILSANLQSLLSKIKIKCWAKKLV